MNYPGGIGLAGPQRIVAGVAQTDAADGGSSVPTQALGKRSRSAEGRESQMVELRKEPVPCPQPDCGGTAQAEVQYPDGGAARASGLCAGSWTVGLAGTGDRTARPSPPTSTPAY